MNACFLVLIFGATPLDGPAIVQHVLETDFGGFSGLQVQARFIMKDSANATNELGFSATGQRYEGTLSRSLLRFTAPTDVAGASFLQIQKRSGDDERYLFLPELHKSRRIGGASRSQAFMGTDFSFADLDGKDWREGKAQLLGEEAVGASDCYKLLVTTPSEDSPYGKMEAWVRKDNFVVVKQINYDKAGNRVKTRVANETKKIQNRWFVTKGAVTMEKDGHSTQIIFDKIVVRSDIAADEFTVRNLEKL